MDLLSWKKRGRKVANPEVIGSYPVSQCKEDETEGVQGSQCKS